MAASMMQAFKLLPGARVGAVASESQERADKFAKVFNIPQAYKSTDHFFAASGIDAVYIANANESHAPMTIQALVAGKAVLCEKPIGVSAAEAEEISAAAAQSGKLCMEAMWTLFLPAYRRLFELAEQSNLGLPLHLYADFGYPASKDAYPRLFAPSPGSGVLLDRGVYPIALALALFGKADQVSGNVIRTDEQVDAMANLQLRHGGGRLSQLAVSINSLTQNRAALSFTAGCISLEPPVIGAETLKITQAKIEANSNSFDAPALKPGLKQRLRQSSILRRVNSWRQAGGGEYHSYGANPYLPMLTHFCELYRAGKLQSEITPLSLSSGVLRIVDQAKRL